jgi:bifunctional DNA-binding transcriptional regulator/antitoxin component of YhaV-PrlF toxin-antitoxin module
MLAKMTSKNQITLPKAVITGIEATDYFDVSVEDGRIILTPVKIQQAQAVRDKLEQLGISERDIADAVQWSRR